MPIAFDHAVPALNPLKILIVADRQETLRAADHQPLVKAIRRAFQGSVVEASDGSEAYYAAGEELGVDIRELFWSKPPNNPASDQRDTRDPEFSNVDAILHSCAHLMVVVLLDRTKEESRSFGQWLNRLAALAEGPLENRIGILPVLLTTEIYPSRLADFDNFQRIPLSELGEAASRAGYLALLVIARTWSLLAGDSERPIRLFISHAKLDGLPIALSIKSQIKALRWLSSFYDARDILPGGRWKRILNRGVRDSAIIILRTDSYEKRPWCQQEIEWADEFGVPAIVVDLRAGSLFPRESLPVYDMMTIRIHDGNLLRVLNAALREAMRIQLFQTSVAQLINVSPLTKATVLVAPRTALSSVGLTCKGCQNPNAIELVLIPEPFRESLREIAERIIKSYCPNAQLRTIQDLLGNSLTP